MASKHFRGSRGARRSSTWLDIPPAGVTLTSMGGTITHSLNADELAKRPFTVVRTHLELQIQSDQSAAAEIQVAGVGLALVSDQALAVGVTAVPTPVTDAESDLWFLHKYLMSSFLFGSGIGFQEPNTRSYTIESKAMRKVNDDQDVIVVLELSNIGAGMIVNIAGRLLIKEH